MSDSSIAIADSIVDEVRALSNGSEAVAVQCDIAEADAPSLLTSIALGKLKTTYIDILVNNAAVTGPASPLDNLAIDDYEQVMTTNLRAVIFLTKAVLPHIRSGGRVVNISSTLTSQAMPHSTIYTASKAAIEGITRVWAVELGQKYGITVNAVSPGPVDTDMWQALPAALRTRMEEKAKMTPAAPRVGTAKDIADIVVFLCEERGRWITGDVVSASGGWMLL